jgi:hypothetical protein
MSDRWLKRWKIPKSSGDGFWTVAIDKKGNYGCSCPVWIFHRKECHHILAVKNNGGAQVIDKPKPQYVLAQVLKPIYKEEENKLFIPLIDIPDGMMMEVTICYTMLKHGYSWAEVKQIRRLPGSWTKQAVLYYIQRNGEACYPESFYRK